MTERQKTSNEQWTIAEVENRRLVNALVEDCFSFWFWVYRDPRSNGRSEIAQFSWEKGYNRLDRCFPHVRCALEFALACWGRKGLG